MVNERLAVKPAAMHAGTSEMQPWNSVWRLYPRGEHWPDGRSLRSMGPLDLHQAPRQ